MNEDTQIVKPALNCEELEYINAMKISKEVTMNLAKTVENLAIKMRQDDRSWSGREFKNCQLATTIRDVAQQLYLMKHDWDHVNHVYEQLVEDNHPELTEKESQKLAEQQLSFTGFTGV